MSFLAFFLALWCALAHAVDATGVLKVRASASGAEVWIDGALVGAAPVTKYIAAGSHKLRVVADNFEPFVRTIEITADRTTELEAALVPGPGSVEFTGPKGAAVWIGGQRYAVPARIPSPGPGKLAYRGEAPGFETAELALDVVKGRNHLVDLVLESSANVLAVNSTPAGAKVFVDGAEVGVTPFKMKGLPPGPHGVEVRAEGYASSFRPADNNGTDRVGIEAKLAKGGASLTLSGLGSDSSVSVNGALVGKGETVKVALVERGKHTITVTDGAHVATGLLEFPSSGAVLARVQGHTVVASKPLTESWAFWAAVGGGAAIVTGGVVSVAMATAPPEPATGDVVMVLP
ncbi:MAG: PEGA domain-containing protein [Deltaproteobacteria bacterium]|nr:PEGA domain-containing protein [Deltaproteobacteria bacterium]